MTSAALIMRFRCSITGHPPVQINCREKFKKRLPFARSGPLRVQKRPNGMRNIISLGLLVFVQPIKNKIEGLLPREAGL